MAEAKSKVGEPVEAPPERKQPANIGRAHLKEEYEGWWFDFDENYTIGQLEELSSQRFLRIRDALVNMVVAWNYVTKEGKPIPITHTIEQFNDVSKSLMEATANAVFEETSVPEV